MNPREQGDLGELSALEWLVSVGAKVAVPLGHSPDWDLIAEFGMRLLRVQVKTTTCFRSGRWEVTLCTRGGNRSWNGLVKHLDPARCDYLFAHVGDGRRWFIPSDLIDGGSKVALGGPKYARFEVEAGKPLVSRRPAAEGAPTILPSTRGDVRVVKGDAL
ncbi:MAG TPA: group I intron-associated PD-(D/E)XK endonuclease [Thermoleophilaceae bacterium]